MARGFTDKNGKFRPTGKNSKSSRDKSIDPQGTKLKFVFKEKTPSFNETIAFVDKRFAESKFDTPEEKDFYERGFDRGLSFAEGSLENLSGIDAGTTTKELEVDDIVDFDKVETDDDLREIVLQSAFEAEENDRQFSPFEITAKEIDEAMFDGKGNQVNDVDQAFQEGIADGINFLLDTAVITKTWW